MSNQIEKFASQANREVLAAMRQLAKEEGRQFYAVLEEAMRDYLDCKNSIKPRRHVMDALGESIIDFDVLYKDLAK